jgi:hypothetical protein
MAIVTLWRFVVGVKLKCHFCGKPFEIRKAEYNRQVRKGRDHFYCSLSCSATKRNKTRPNRRVQVNKVCPYCGEEFQTMTGSKSATFCSRSCASAGSVTEKRRSAQKEAGNSHKENLISASETLKIRESWKYEKVRSFLEFQGEDFEFEYPLEKSVFDLALKNRRVLVVRITIILTRKN